MRSWAVQKFLNPGHSSDDGWFKFSIRKKPRGRHRRNLEYDILFTVADCNERITLDFTPYPRDYDDSVPGAREEAYLEAIKERRKKINLLANSVATFADKLNTAFDEEEAYFNVLLKEFTSSKDTENE